MSLYNYILTQRYIQTLQTVRGDSYRTIYKGVAARLGNRSRVKEPETKKNKKRIKKISIKIKKLTFRR